MISFFIVDYVKKIKSFKAYSVKAKLILYFFINLL